jgi:hypothetical protein
MYYRPPWGIVNVFDYANLGYLQIVLWTSLFRDWRKRVGSDKLYRRMRRKLQPGQVFLLHDCGITFGANRDAPANMITALERILDDGKELGYRFVGIDEMINLTEQWNKRKINQMSVRIAGMKSSEPVSDDLKSRSIGPFKKFIVGAWMLWEKVFHKLFRLRPIGDGKSFNYRVRKYTGPPLDLRANTTLHSGDHIMEIHFENQMLYKLGMSSRSALQTGIKIIREMEKALPDMARELATTPNGDMVKALYGVSMIHRGGESLGYGTYDLPRGLFSWMTNIYLRILIRVIHPEGNDRVRTRGEKMNPRMLIMPRELLLTWADESRARRRPEREHNVKPGVGKKDIIKQETVAFQEETLGKLV